MKKEYKRLAFVISILLILVVAIWNINNSPNKAKSESQKLVNENLNRVEFSNVVKGREFKGNNLKYNDKSIPILMYHSIDYEKGNELRVPKEVFREQMNYLKQNEYTTLSLNELYDFLVNNKPVPSKSIVITFDDGYRDNFENAYPVLKEFGFNASIFVITSTVDNDKSYLTSKQLKELEASGIEIESHTVNHEQLDKLTYGQQINTLKSSREYIEKILGKQKRYTAYPFGKWNNDTIRALKDTGYSMAFTTQSGWANKNQGIYELHRVYISAKHDIKEFERRIKNENYNKNN